MQRRRATTTAQVASKLVGSLFIRLYCRLLQREKNKFSFKFLSAKLGAPVKLVKRKQEIRICFWTPFINTPKLFDNIIFTSILKIILEFIIISCILKINLEVYASFNWYSVPISYTSLFSEPKQQSKYLIST